MDRSPVSLATAAEIEAAEARSWADLYAAAPAGFAHGAGLKTREFGGTLMLSWAATGRRYFSRAIGLGVVEPATEEQLDEILAAWREEGITMFLLQSLPHCRPSAYESWLRERGLEPFDAQDRLVRDGSPPAEGTASSSRELAVERVDRESQDEWAEFLQRVYRLDTGPWLQELAGRPGWYQYVARAGGEIVAARAMHIGPDGTAWLGMDGPVPGLMTDEYEPDAAICARIVAEGLAAGVRSFIADIEAPSEAMDTPAYEYFGRLGFSRPYVRTHWRWSDAPRSGGFVAIPTNCYAATSRWSPRSRHRTCACTCA